MLTDLETQMLLRHVSSRWLSLKPVLIRISGQWLNLRQYFLKFLPKEKNFAREIASTARYKDIKRVLNDKLSQPYIAELLDEFLIKFQSTFDEGRSSFGSKSTWINERKRFCHHEIYP